MEHVMLVILLILSAVFFLEPIVEGYPKDSRVFPQLTSAFVFIGVSLLLLRNYLPEPLRVLVAENVTITSESSESKSKVQQKEEEDVHEKDTLGKEYGYEINDTNFMISTAIVYFFAGWAAGFFFVTPLYVAFYTLWYKAGIIKSVFLAVLATVILWIFMEFLGMPFDQGHILDFSPFLPFFVDAFSTLVWGVR